MLVGRHAFTRRMVVVVVVVVGGGGGGGGMGGAGTEMGRGGHDATMIMTRSQKS